MRDLEVIKNYFGEEMMHYVRSNFGLMLEEGVFLEIFLNRFSKNKELYNDLKNNSCLNKFKDYIYFIYNLKYKKDTNQALSEDSPSKLLKTKGYTLYECLSEEDISKFKKYFAKGEELCTFNGGRLNDSYVFFAVKDNALELKREEFVHPKREDEYGTSVLSIQFSKTSAHILTISNRYNHTVANPDVTYNNNLDNIVSGLTQSFARSYNLSPEFETILTIPGYIRANDGKYYKYNYELNSICYCPNNVVIDEFEVKSYEPEKYLVIGPYILDLVNKRMTLYDNKLFDSFINQYNHIDKIRISKCRDNTKNVIIYSNNQYSILKLDSLNNLISYFNKDIKIIEDDFLHCANKIISIYLPKAEEIGNNFAICAYNLQKVYLAHALIIKDKFCRYAMYLKDLYIPKVEEIKDDFGYDNNTMRTIKAPNLKRVGNNFLYLDSYLEEIDCPSLEIIGKYFANYAKNIHIINLPNIKSIGNNFLYMFINIYPSYLDKLNFALKDNYNLSEYPYLRRIK